MPKGTLAMKTGRLTAHAETEDETPERRQRESGSNAERSCSCCGRDAYQLGHETCDESSKGAITFSSDGHPPAWCRSSTANPHNSIPP
eukprot:scaffold5178_cov107-Isochrysis_galbana.AAC.3